MNYLSITKQREPRYDWSSPLRCDPWMIKVHLRSLGLHANSVVLKIFLFRYNEKMRESDRGGERGYKEWKAKLKRHHREWGSKEEFLIQCCLPACLSACFPARLIRSPSLSAWIWLYLFKAKDDLLTLTWRPVTSDILVQQIASLPRTYLCPAAYISLQHPSWGYVTRFTVLRWIQQLLFLG